MESPLKGQTGFRRLLNALIYSRDGLIEAFRHEAAFRQEVCLSLVLVPVGLVLPIEALGKALLIGSVLLVLVVELVNSALEAVVDRISLDAHHLAKRAKDLGSAAVFLSLVNLVAVWFLVLLA